MAPLPVLLAPNFALAEFVKASRGRTWPAQLDANALAMAKLLQQVRDSVSAPVYLTSFYREGDPNQHGRASAADFWVQGLDPATVGRRIIGARARGEIGAYGQLIIYPYTTQHVHLSLPEPQIRDVNRNLVKVRSGYAKWDGGALPSFSSGAVFDDTAPDPATEQASGGVTSIAAAVVLLALLFNVRG